MLSFEFRELGPKSFGVELSNGVGSSRNAKETTAIMNTLILSRRSAKIYYGLS